MTSTPQPNIESLLRDLAGLGLNREDIAAATGAPAEDLRDWPTDTAPLERVADRLQQLHQLASKLSDSLDPPGPAQWLRAPNRMLAGHVPLAVLRDGDYDRVLGAVNAYLHGAYL